MQKLLVIMFSIWSVAILAQNKQILYGLREVPQSLLLNPGSQVPQNKHYGVPFLSQLHINGGSSGVTIYDIFGETSEDINTKIRNKIFELKSTDFFTATEQWAILDFGWRAKNGNYYSAGVYQELDFISYFPRDLAILAWEGNRDYLGYKFDLGELSITGDLLTVYHLGVNKKISQGLTVGIRGKVYSSIFSFRSVHNQGTFETDVIEGSDNVYVHFINGADISIKTAGYTSLRDADGPGQAAKRVAGRALLGGNLGLGIDVGFTYDINDNLSVSGSILDFGAIFNTKDVETYKAKGNYQVEGVELLFPPLEVGQETIPYFDNIETAFEGQVPIDTLSIAYTQFRPVKTNAAITYSFGIPVGGKGACNCTNMDDSNAKNQQVGVQFYGVFRPKGPQLAATLFYYQKMFNFLAAKIAYTADSYSYMNIGAGLVTDIGRFNFYLAADNLLKYGNIAKAKSVSLQVGFNIIIDE